MWSSVDIVLTDVSEACSQLLTLVHRSPISYTLKMEAIYSSETSVNIIATRRHTPEDVILYSHRRENLRSYKSDSFAPHLVSIFCASEKAISVKTKEVTVGSAYPTQGSLMHTKLIVKAGDCKTFLRVSHLLNILCIGLHVIL
jgi:hypothetical protein